MDDIETIVFLSILSPSLFRQKADFPGISLCEMPLYLRAKDVGGRVDFKPRAVKAVPTRLRCLRFCALDGEN